MSPERASQLVFGEIPAAELSHRRRSQASRRERPANQETYQDYRALPLIEQILSTSWKDQQREREKRRDLEKTIFASIWPEGVEIPWHISPSTASSCLRLEGFRILGYLPAQPETEAILVMNIGSATHFSILRTVTSYLPDSRQETSFTLEDEGVSGRADLLFANPKTGERQVWELKTMGDYPFSQIKREGLPSYLLSTQRIYSPLPEHRKQALLYLWALNKQNLGVTCANIIYINRDNGKMKEALILWNAATEFEAQQLIEQIKQAKIQIENGELPEPTVESRHICSTICGFAYLCDAGQREVAKRKPKMPDWIRKQAKQQEATRREKMIASGRVQAELPGLENIPPRLTKKETGKKPTSSGPACGECGGETRWDTRAAKGGKWVCTDPSCHDHGK